MIGVVAYTVGKQSALLETTWKNVLIRITAGKCFNSNLHELKQYANVPQGFNQGPWLLCFMKKI
jgi:hypothetical protein